MLIGSLQLIAGGEEKIPAVFKLLDKEGIKTKKDPDLYMRTYKNFGAEEARALRQRAMLAPIGPRRVFLLVTPNITLEAQNTLLKITEEGSALFIFIHPAPLSLLPTIRSRAQLLTLGGSRAEGSVDEKAFIAAGAEKRLDMLKPLLEKDENDARDLGAMLNFLASLEQQYATVKEISKKRAGLEAIYLARKYIADKGALSKSLLEQVALLMPR